MHHTQGHIYNHISNIQTETYILPSRNVGHHHKNDATLIQQVPGSNASNMQRQWSCKETCRNMHASFAQSCLLWSHSKDIIAFWSLRIIKLQTCRYSFKQRKSLQSMPDFFPWWVKIETWHEPSWTECNHACLFTLDQQCVQPKQERKLAHMNLYAIACWIASQISQKAGLSQKHFGSKGQRLMMNMHKHDLVTCKKQFKTLRNNIKRFQTNSSNSDNLWRWYVQRQSAFPDAVCLPAQFIDVAEMQKPCSSFIAPSQLRYPLKMVCMEVKMATSNVTKMQSPKYISVGSMSDASTKTTASCTEFRSEYTILQQIAHQGEVGRGLGFFL